MELKYASTEFQKICRYGSNRTFMELKFLCAELMERWHKVLIVPLWN